MEPLSTTALRGRQVLLEPLALAHVESLLAAASESRESYAIANVPADVAGMRRFVEEALADAERGRALPFVTVSVRERRVVGSTRFGSAERWSWPGPPAPPLPVGPDAVEIGWTWLAASAQRTAINTEAKLLMLTHAFEVWRVRRVTLKTDARNARSRAAMDRIGCRFDGILRAHMPAWGGGVRDSAMYSVIATEWPEVRAGLLARVNGG